MHAEASTSERPRTWHRDIVCALLEQQTPVCFSPQGPSMNPLIRNGDSVRVRPVSGNAIRQGQILLFRQAGRLTLHRMIRQRHREDGYLMAADAALEGLESVDATDILGLADTVLRDGRERRLVSRLARWHGLARYYARPLRRLVIGWIHRWPRQTPTGKCPSL